MSFTSLDTEIHDRVRVRRLVNPTPDELDHAAKTSSAAFVHDPMAQVCTGGDRAVSALFERATVAAAALAGEVWVATVDDSDRGTNLDKDPDADFAGVVAVWPPSRTLMDSPDQVACFDAFFAGLSEELRKWWKEYLLPRMSQHTTEVLGPGTEHDAYNLIAFGVRPAYQRRGVGSALVRAILDRASAEGRRVTLSTGPQTVVVYEHWGFAPRGGVETYVGPAGEFDDIIMVREP